MKHKKYISMAMGLAAVAGLVMAVPVSADSTNVSVSAQATTQVGTGMRMMRGGRGGMMGMRPAVVGTVSAVSGNSITISGREFTKPVGTPATSPVATTFTVDATNATITKANAASTVSNIAVGDTIAVEGTVTGSNIVATSIRDGVMMGKGEGKMGGFMGEHGEGTSTPVVVGNGQPIVAGSVTAVNGTTLSITNKSNASYTIDASNAKIVQDNKLVTLSNVAVGDSVVVQGTVNGSAVTAYSVTDQKVRTTTTANGTVVTHTGFLGKVGQFFSHLFGF